MVRSANRSAEELRPEGDIARVTGDPIVSFLGFYRLRVASRYSIRSWLLIFQWQIKYLADTSRLSADELMSFPSLIAELEVAVKSGTPEKRVDTLRRVTNLFLEGSDRFNEQQISVFDDVLVHLIQRIESKALVQLSKSLAPVDNAPL